MDKMRKMNYAATELPIGKRGNYKLKGESIYRALQIPRLESVYGNFVRQTRVGRHEYLLWPNNTRAYIF